MIIMCFKIFLARICDVTLGTIRTIYSVQGKMKKASIFAFLEVLIWFYVAREALTSSYDLIFIPISYALGYATGTYIGTFLANNFIKSYVCLEFVTSKDFNDLFYKEGYQYSSFELDNNYDNHLKKMYILKIESRKLNMLLKLIKRFDKKAFLLVKKIETL